MLLLVFGLNYTMLGWSKAATRYGIGKEKCIPFKTNSPIEKSAKSCPNDTFRYATNINHITETTYHHMVVLSRSAEKNVNLTTPCVLQFCGTGRQSTKLSIFQKKIEN